MTFKRLVLSSISLAIAGTLVMLIGLTPRVHANFNQNMVMSDGIFSNTGTMSITSINNFLNQFPSSCLSPNNGFSSPDPTGYSPSTGYTYGGNVTGGQVIYDAAQAYGINPQVLIATLQKESSVVTGDASYHCTYINTAMGYGCPDSGSCPTNPATMSGFSKQVIHAAWLLRFGQQRSLGNTGWNVQANNFPQGGDHWDNSDDPPTCYGGPMTQGNLSRGCGQAATFYDGYTTIDSQSVHIDSGATAALYWYTPHFSGNQHFVSIFENWFGSTRAGYCLPGGPGVQTGVLFQRYNRGYDSPTFLIYSGSGSGCIEEHVWNLGMQSWQAHIASNQPSVNYPDLQVLYGDLDGGGLDYPLLFGVRNTSTGKVESHVWSHNMQSWLAHAASNQPAIDPSDCKIIVADLDGTRDKPILVCERNTSSGKIEFHVWNPGMQSWQSHVITNMPTVDPAQNTVVAGNIDGSGKDSLILVAYNHTGSGKVEFHIWNPGQWSWRDHIATNMPELDPQNANVQFAHIFGGNLDQAILVANHNTGSGRIEFHIWNPGYQSWNQHVASNQVTIP